MKIITVGAFEAKTHLSQLLTEVEKGAEVHITRRGKLVAILRSQVAVSTEKARETLRRIATYRTAVSRDDIERFTDEGRER